MSSHARSTREQERRISIRTLMIASVASATAAILTSQFWVRGTPFAAALTPVIVALVSELLNRPTERIAQRLTTETRALPRDTDLLPEAAGAGPPPPRQEHDPRPARDAPLSDPFEGRGATPEFTVYRTPPPRRALRWGPILATAAIAFAIAAAALTLPELIAGQSVGRGDRNFTLFGGGADRDSSPEREPRTETEEPQPGRQATAPEKTVPQLEPTPEQAETEPQTTTVPKTETETETDTDTTPTPRSQGPAP